MDQLTQSGIAAGVAGAVGTALGAAFRWLSQRSRQASDDARWGQMVKRMDRLETDFWSAVKREADLRVRNAELEVEVAQLRNEVAQLRAALASQAAHQLAREGIVKLK
jgi:hypothetical protein